jgi:heme-degrading monooxygenase HmoA
MNPTSFLRCLSLLLAVANHAACAFSLAPSSASTLARCTRNTTPRSFLMQSSTSTVEEDSTLTADGLLKRDRYIATNRFAVRSGKSGKFEQRWATRKSRLASLPGFRYFHLMRRVTPTNKPDGPLVYDEGDSDDSAQENYVSFTVWDRKSDFSAWRKGDAFKEAHGGTSIGAFLSTMVNSALVLRGAPRPAFYDGLLVRATKPEQVPQTVDGWRQVEANGVDTLPAECFVEMTKYYIPSDQAVEFERFWQQWSNGAAPEGVVASGLMRRDGQAKGHGTVSMTENEPTYVGVAIYKDFASYQLREPAAAPKMGRREPVTVYYEGTLVISSDQGA